MITTDQRGDDLQANFIDESHIELFAAALKQDDYGSDLETSAVASPASSPGPKALRVRKISALSDFAPIQTKVSRARRRRQIKTEQQREFVFHLVRWPLLFLIAVVIFGQFGLYVSIRQVVNTFEWLFAWRGRKGQLRQKLRNAKSYEEWKEAAQTLDEYLGFNDWKKEEEDPYYDYLLVKKVRRTLRSLRQKNDARGLLGVLDLCLRANFAGTESSRLYSETFYGTKDAIESYISEVEASIDFVRHSPNISIEEKRRFFKSANRNVGSSALCLSGGATFGYYHFGVIKALLDLKLMPRVIAGTSCGSLIAALVCTRSDEELKALLVPELAHRITACEEGFFTWFRRFLETGARFDTVDWARKACFFTRGSMTFREAYELTGRVLNISVIPFDRHSPTKLLNYLTAPDCVIWSAVIASAAVPGILNPVVLMAKTRSGTIVPWSWGSRFKDGSLRVDIPLQSLHLLFNVSHPIVSQVNPHVHLFFFASRGSAGRPVAHRKGKGWRGGFLLSAAEQFLKHELTKNFKVIRDLELMPQLLGQDWSSVFLQKFEGSVTILPKTRLMDWVHILSDPNPHELERMLRVGQQVTWPKLHMIENRMRIERKIFRGRLMVKRAAQAKSDKTPNLIGHSTEVPTSVMGALLSSSVLNQADNSSADYRDPEAPRRVPVIFGSERMAVESDAEAGFAAGSEKFFKKPREHSRARKRAASQNLSQIQMDANQPILPEIIVQQNSPEEPSMSPSASLSTIPSLMKRRRWGSSLHNTSEEPTIAPLPASDSKPQEEALTPPPTTADSRTRTFLDRLRSTSFSAITSPFVRMGSTNRDADTRSLASAQLADERWSSESSSDDGFILNDEQTPGPSGFSQNVGGEENRGWSLDNPRPEAEDADLTAVDVPDSP